jgi:hypothetical protein
VTLYKIAEFCTRWFSGYPNITSKFRIIAIFKSFVKENNDSNETCRCGHDLLLNQTSLVEMQRFVSCLHKTKYVCMYFFNFPKNCLDKMVYTFKMH